MHILVLIISLFFLASTHLYAIEQPTSLTISPAMVELTLKPEVTSTTSLTLINNSQIPLPIRATANPLESSFKTTSTRYNASSWISINPTDFILQPGSNKLVTLTLTPPKDALAGGHYATIIFEPLIPESLVATPQALARVGSILLLSIPGTITESLSLTNPQIPRITTSLPQDYTIELQNTGTSHLLPTFNISLRDIKGQPINTLPVSSSLILPEETKTYTFRWESINRPGKYTISGNITFGSQDQKLELPITSVWFIPIWQIVIIVILTTIIIWIILRYRRIIFAIKILISGKYPYDTTPTSQSNQ